MLLGASFGFSTFLISVGCIEGVLFRPDDTNKQRFTLVNIGQFMKAPFEVGTEPYKAVWGIVPGISIVEKLKLMSMNWILLTGAGYLIEYAIRYYLNNKPNYLLK